jgi:hypothetical protein
MLVPELYRQIEKERGRSLREIGAAGVAFTREDTLKALDCLKGSQVAVLGGDVLETVDGSSDTRMIAGTQTERPEEDLTDYLKRSIVEAERYIRRFPDPEDGTILYSPVISELGVIGGAPN